MDKETNTVALQEATTMEASMVSLLDECQERSQAELDFVTSAYEPHEAWVTTATTTVPSGPSDKDQSNNVGETRIHRRFQLRQPDNGLDDSLPMVVLAVVDLVLTLPETYPVESSLQISAQMAAPLIMTEEPTSTSMSTSFQRQQQQHPFWTTQFLPRLVQVCETVTREHLGEETVFLVLHQAQEWIQSMLESENNEVEEVFSPLDKACRQELRKLCQAQFGGSGGGTSTSSSSSSAAETKKQPVEETNHSTPTDEFQSITRCIVWSHEMRVKLKGSGGDTIKVAKQYDITGILKIGWPGLMIIEGIDCDAFVHDIQPRCCHAIQIKGSSTSTSSNEEKDHPPPDNTSHGESALASSSMTTTTTTTRQRVFDSFQVVETMGEIARACKERGPEIWELFCTAFPNGAALLASGTMSSS